MSGPNLLAFTHAAHHVRDDRRRPVRRVARVVVAVVVFVATTITMAWCAAT
jgi:hypothetical protein